MKLRRVSFLNQRLHREGRAVSLGKCATLEGILHGGFDHHRVKRQIVS